MNRLKQLYLIPVYLYKKILSPILPATCRYQPSCSSYFIEAVNKKGIIRGTIKGIGRICRCHPFKPGGYDPVD